MVAVRGEHGATSGMDQQGAWPRAASSPYPRPGLRLPPEQGRAWDGEYLLLSFLVSRSSLTSKVFELQKVDTPWWWGGTILLRSWGECHYVISVHPGPPLQLRANRLTSTPKLPSSRMFPETLGVWAGAIPPPPWPSSLGHSSRGNPSSQESLCFFKIQSRCLHRH